MALEDNPIPFVRYEKEEALVCVKGEGDFDERENIVLARFHIDMFKQAKGVADFLLDLKHNCVTVNKEAVIEYLAAIGIGGDDG